MTFPDVFADDPDAGATTAMRGPVDLRRAVCPGSFDPVTYGHLDIIERTARLFDSVVVAVGANQGKNAYFTPAERVELLQEVCRPWPVVEVAIVDGLLVDFCREREAQVVVKGLRFVSDFDYELQMAQMNSHLSGIDTVFMPTAAQWAYVSSSLVREVARLGGEVAQFLPEPVARRMATKAAGKAAERAGERREAGGSPFPG